MVQLLVVGVIALLVSAGAALAQTKVITGDKGLSRQVVSGAKLYDATKATVLVEQGKNNTGYNITGSPQVATLLGGRTLGQGINRTQSWVTVHAKGNGACVRFEKSPGLTVRRHYGEFCWDGLKPATGSGNWRVEDSWLKHIRDDAIEADHVGAHNGVVRRTFFDGVHTFISVTPGQSQPISTRVRVEFDDNLMSLGCGVANGNCENRAKRLADPYSRPRGSGQAFKVRGCGDQVDMLFRGNRVMMGAELVGGQWQPVGLNTAAAPALFQCIRIQPGSTGNTFYWLGPTPANCSGVAAGLSFTRLHGACVPAQFKLNPAVFTAASNDRAAWLAAVARWQGQVWKGAAASSAPSAALKADPGQGPAQASPADAGGDLLVAVDVRPRQCPNRVRVGQNGTIPVVIAGNDGFDVRDIDARSIRLAGVAPQHQRTQVKDLATAHEPFVGKTGSGDCTRSGADGLEDLLMRFNSHNLVRALGPASNGAVVAVPLTGKLADGTPIRGQDVILVLN
jgi:hypothetical protein